MSAAIKITEGLARKVLGVVDAGLVSGLGKPEPGQMCVEAAVCYAMGLPHSDEPTCVGSAVRKFKIRLNDARWSSNATRTQGLRKLAIAQLGSDTLDQRAFAKIVAEQCIRQVVPIALRAAAGLNPKHANALEAAAVKCEQKGTTDSAREARAAADAAAGAAAADASAGADAVYAYAAAYADAAAGAAAASAGADAVYAYAAAYADAAAGAAAASAGAGADAVYAYAAADAAADAAAGAADASAGADAVYAYAAAYAAAGAAAGADAARDRVLFIAAEIGLRALIELKSPGCAFLHLAEAA